ncbi:MAG: hypothetical protein RI894_2247 [Bacteroidota bacterium]|jgi:UDP-N-acetylglucosamine acyltransferase
MSSHHPLASIDRRAVIGENVVIEAFAHIEEDVVIGDDCWIGSHAVLKNGTRLGKNCKVFHGAVLGAKPQDLKFKDEATLLEIGENNVIREYCTLNRGTLATGRTSIGNHNMLMAYAHVAHDCFIGDHCVIANSVNLAGHVEVGDWAIIGGATQVHQFSKIGGHVMISGGSLVQKDVPPFVKAARNPLSYAGVNTIGLERRGFSREQITQIQNIYRVLFVRGYNVVKAVGFIQNDCPESDEKTHILEFIAGADRGLIKGFQSVRD